MKIEGQIEDIIFQNETNGYTVAEIETLGETVTIVGYLPFINNGDVLMLFGNYVTHQEYGKQFKVDTFEKMIPKTTDAIIKYLSGGLIKGVGPATAERIVNLFGEETIDILMNQPQKLARVKGISQDKAIKIGTEFNEKWELWQIVRIFRKIRHK
jgi:exodeoxyribonuclease V alpha subunit